MKERNKKIAFFDLDGTLVSCHLWLGLLKYYLKRRENLFWPSWYFISHIFLTPLWMSHLISKERYYRTWGKDLAMMVKGIKKEKGKEIWTWVVDQYLLPSLKVKVLERLQNHQKQGYITILTSTSFQEILEIIRTRLHFDYAVGTRLEIVEDRYSGRIIPPLCFNEGKLERIKELLREKNIAIDFEKSFAYSDSIFDLPMLQLVAHPVAVEPDKELKELAKTKNWTIIE